MRHVSIDMIPALLSSNLCSLRGGEDRFALSCIWEMTKDARIVSTRFCKSIIKSDVCLAILGAADEFTNIRFLCVFLSVCVCVCVFFVFFFLFFVFFSLLFAVFFPERLYVFRGTDGY